MAGTNLAGGRPVHRLCRPRNSSTCGCTSVPGSCPCVVLHGFGCLRATVVTSASASMAVLWILGATPQLWGKLGEVAKAIRTSAELVLATLRRCRSLQASFQASLARVGVERLLEGQDAAWKTLDRCELACIEGGTTHLYKLRARFEKVSSVRRKTEADEANPPTNPKRFYEVSGTRAGGLPSSGKTVSPAFG